MSKFKVGDRVRTTNNKKTGVVLDAGEKVRGQVAIKTDNQHDGVLLSCFGNVRGLWMKEDRFELIAPARTEKIIITADGQETTARLYNGKRLVKEASAKCSESDTFDFAAGARLAFDRLMGAGEPEKAPEKPVGWNGKVFCLEVSKHSGKDFTVGHVYEVKDGRVYDNDGHVRAGQFAFITSAEQIEVSSQFGKFRAIKGGAI